MALLEYKFSADIDEKQTLLKQKKDTENKLEALEEKFISGDIEKGLFEKFGTRYKNILLDIGEKSSNPMHNSSNFKKAIFKGVEIAANLSQL